MEPFSLFYHEYLLLQLIQSTPRKEVIKTKITAMTMVVMVAVIASNIKIRKPRKFWWILEIFQKFLPKYSKTWKLPWNKSLCNHFYPLSFHTVRNWWLSLEIKWQQVLLNLWNSHINNLVWGTENMFMFLDDTQTTIIDILENNYWLSETHIYSIINIRICWNIYQGHSINKGNCLEK